MKEHSKEIIRKYINGKCSDEERSVMKKLLADPHSQKLIEEVLQENGNPIREEEIKESEQMKVWLLKMNKHILIEEKTQRKLRYSFPYFLKYAAVWIVAFFTIGFFVYQYHQQHTSLEATHNSITNTERTALRIVLEDSSIVTLAPGGKLEFSKHFKAEKRIVQLQGEAFFEVSKDPTRPFIVQSDSFQTQVLGTSFKIKSIKNEPFRVEVATGKVSVKEVLNNSGKELALLIPGEAVQVISGKTKRYAVNTQQILDWQKGFLSYRNFSLEEICNELSYWHHIKFVIQEESLKKIKLNIQLRANSTIEQNMQILAATTGLTYKSTENQIIIYEKNLKNSSNSIKKATPTR